MVVDGLEAEWRCDWDFGVAPYSVGWDFGGGALNPPGQLVNESQSSATVLMRIIDYAIPEYALNVTVTDALGSQGTAELLYSFALPAELNITALITAEGELDVTVTGGSGPYSIWVSEPSGLETSQPRVESADGHAVFSFTATDPVIGGGGLCDIVAQDASGIVSRTDTFIGIEAMQLNDDTIYAIPLHNEADVNESVTILVATGRTAHPFQYMTGVGVTVPDDGSYVPNSLNYGAPGGERRDADGTWAAITTDGGFLIPPSPLIQPGPDPDGTLEPNFQRYDFSIFPLGGADVESASGALFNLQFSFSSPGEKEIGFQEFNGVNRTYYSDFASGEDHFWSHYEGATVTVE